jgi:hypothetical protein
VIDKSLSPISSYFDNIVFMFSLSVKGTHVDCADYLVRSGCDMNKQVVEGKCSHIKKKKKEKTNQNQLQIKDTQLTRDSRRTDK